MKSLWMIAAAALSLQGPTQIASENGGIRILPLPDAAAFPEGVAADPQTGDLYVNSAITGVIFHIDPSTGAAKIVGDPLGMAETRPAGSKSIALGLKVDDEGRLWVAGARDGSMHVVDAATGRRIARYTTPAGPWLINDVVVTADAAYFTDSLRKVLWRIPRETVADGVPEPWLRFEGTALDIREAPDLNGIAATPDGRSLIVVHAETGRLFHIDTVSRDLVEIDKGGANLSTGDGLVLDGQRLFVVRQSAAEIVALRLSSDLLTAREIKRIKVEELQWPATAAISGSRLIVANSQLNRRSSGDPVLPFSLVSIPLTIFD